MVRLSRSSRLLTTLALVMLLTLLLAMPAFAAGRPFATTLTGAAEVPGPGDPDGSGTAHIDLNVGRSEICYHLVVSDIAPAHAAHIHVGTADQAGPVVVTLGAPTTGESSGCVTADQDLIKAILQHPENYYVNVHNAEYPAGALRGQLSK